MSGIFAAITEVCRQEGWELTEIEEGVAALIETGEDEGFACMGHAREKQNQFLCLSSAFEEAPPDRRSAVCEFITRLNYDLVIGDFEMNIETGEVRFKTSMDFDKAAASVDQIATLVYANTTIMAKFLPLLLEVMAADLSPVEAMARVQSM